MSDYRTEIEKKVAAQFEGNAAEHELTVLHDDGLYRHIRMAKPGTWMYRYDLITWPGHLAISGDLDSYVFTRVEDMFTFFRNQEVNPTYWAEKVKDGRERTKAYSQEKFEPAIGERFTNINERTLTDEQRHTLAELRERVKDGAYYSEEARDILDDGERAGLLSDTWEMSLSDWDWHFLYCLNAIVAGIKAYDEARAGLNAAAEAVAE